MLDYSACRHVLLNADVLYRVTSQQVQSNPKAAYTVEQADAQDPLSTT